jgi:hypothetical protein
MSQEHSCRNCGTPFWPKRPWHRVCWTCWPDIAAPRSVQNAARPGKRPTPRNPIHARKGEVQR